MERERRIVSTETGEVRAQTNEDGDVGITGSAIVFDQVVPIGGDSWGWDEVIKAEAVEGLLDRDIRGLFNHDPNMILARNGKTMTVEKRKGAVWYDIPKLPSARADVAQAVERGDVTGNSFSFSMPPNEEGERWIRPADRKDGGTRPLREVLRFADIHDVGPVTFPAYEGTTVSTRAEARAKDCLEPPPEPVPDWKVPLLREKERCRDELEKA